MTPATMATTPSNTTITLIQRGSTRSTMSTSGSIRRATIEHATTQPTMRWASTNMLRSTKAVTTAPTISAAEAGVSPACQTRTRRAEATAGGSVSPCATGPR